MMMATRNDGARCAWWLCAFMAASVSLYAQTPADPQQQAVPEEFARVLLVGGSVELRVGRMPADLPTAEQIAAGARVVGSVVWRDRSATALAVSTPVAEARVPFEERLRAAGWTEGPPSGLPQRGFLPPHAQDPERGFCWPETDARLAVNVRDAPDGGSYIVVTHYEPRPGRQCAEPSPPQRAAFTILESMMPSLRPPDGAEVTRRGGGGGGSEYEIRSAITPQYTPAQLIRHFQPQLAEQGWSITEQLTGDAMAIVSARRRLENGTNALVLVSAIREDEEQIALVMRIVERRSP